jgi:hypothetical protein
MPVAWGVVVTRLAPAEVLIVSVHAACLRPPPRRLRPQGLHERDLSPPAALRLLLHLKRLCGAANYLKIALPALIALAVLGPTFVHRTLPAASPSYLSFSDVAASIQLDLPFYGAH